MIECKLILPVKNNEGIDLLETHRDLKNLLVRNYGGCTISNAVGCWEDKKSGQVFDEAVIIYQVAISNNIIDKEQFKSFAIEYGKKAGQLAVYYAINGKPHIVELD